MEDVGGEVVIPDNIDAVRARSLDDHIRWRLKVRESFQTELAKGAIVCHFARDARTGESRYVFGRDEDQFHFDAYTGIRTGSTAERT